MIDFIKFISSYLTLWNIILGILYINKLIPIYYSSSLLLLSTFVLVGGFYIHYIKPKSLTIPFFSKNGIILKNKTLVLVDIIYHILPFMTLYNYIKIKKIILNKDCTLFISVLILYNLFNNIENRYKIDYIDCCIIYIFTILIYRIIIKYNK